MSGPSDAYFLLAIASHCRRNASRTSVSRESGAGELADLRMSTIVSDDSLCTVGITRERRGRPCTRCRGRQGKRDALRGARRHNSTGSVVMSTRPKVDDDGPLHSPRAPAPWDRASRLRAPERVPPPFRKPPHRRPLVWRDTTSGPRRLGAPDDEGPRLGCPTGPV